MHGTRRSPAIPLGIAFLLAAAGPLLVLAGEGQGTAEPGANLAQLDTGQLVYGAELVPEEWLGKVVVVNIGGG